MEQMTQQPSTADIVLPRSGRWPMNLNGDFAAGQRTMPQSSERPSYARGQASQTLVIEGPDFARGERTQLLSLEGPDYARGLRQTSQ